MYYETKFKFKSPEYVADYHPLSSSLVPNMTLEDEIQQIEDKIQSVSAIFIVSDLDIFSCFSWSDLS